MFLVKSKDHTVRFAPKFLVPTLRVTFLVKSKDHTLRFAPKFLVPTLRVHVLGSEEQRAVLRSKARSFVLGSEER